MNQTEIEKTDTQVMLANMMLVNDALDRLLSGQSEQTVMTRLKEKGIDEATASAIVREAKKAASTHRRKKGLKAMAIGGFWLVIGLLATAGLYHIGVIWPFGWFIALGGFAPFIAGLVQLIIANRNAR